MTFQLPAVENKSACKFRKKSTLLLCSTVYTRTPLLRAFFLLSVAVALKKKYIYIYNEMIWGTGKVLGYDFI